MKSVFYFLCFLTISVPLCGNAQVIGGRYAFEYLLMSNSPHISALGGMVPASNDADVAFTLQNPGLLQDKMHNQLAISYNNYYAGISIANLQYAYHVPQLKTTFGLGIQYLNYGKFNQTDLFGNILGEVRASDFSVNLSAARSYKQHWHYGATLKFAYSHLGDRNAFAMLADVGVTYVDTANLLVFGLVGKNMGVTLDRYNSGNTAEPLPFDLQLGISKQLKNVPLRFYMAAHHLYEWDIRYNNPADKVNENFFGMDDSNSVKEKSYFADKLFRHLNFGAELTLARRVTLTAAYSHLHRSELAASDKKGLAGFSLGVGVHLSKIQVRYSRSYYTTAGAYNEIGFAFQVNKFFGIGNKTEPWAWNASY
jgi:hypothetical protein